MADYKNTLNLPQTDFAMKANLSQSEPATLARWEAMGLYDRLEKERASAPHQARHAGHHRRWCRLRACPSMA